jgi:hypothetical protein
MNNKPFLKLFNAVLADDIKVNNFNIIKEYGVVVSPGAMYALEEIKEFLKENALSGSQLNSSFYKNWSQISNLTLEQRLRDQCLHYFTTYGFESIGIYDPDSVYVVNTDPSKDLPAKIALKVIKGISVVDAIKACLDMLASGIALKQETIEDILTVLDVCEYTFTGSENIKNREAQILIADRTGVLPQKSDDLFRYLVYKSTGETLVIRNAKLHAAIVESNYELPSLSETLMRVLARSFNRNKYLWLAFKKAHVNNKKTVNRIAKLSKTEHEPQKPNVLGTLTSNQWSPLEVNNSLQGANAYQAVRALNALEYYSHVTSPARFYKVRNGKGFATSKHFGGRSHSNYSEYRNILKEFLSKKIENDIFYVPEGVDYALPTSEKMFSDNIPKMTSVEVPYSDKNILIGVYWENTKYRVDLDLSGQSISEKVGWNGQYNTHQVMYSGDMTDAPNGASEWLYFKNLKDRYLVTVNNFNRVDEAPFKIIVGYGPDSVEHNYMIDPNDVIFEVDSKTIQRQMLLGVIEPTKTGVRFILADQGMSNKNVSRFGLSEAAVLEDIFSRVKYSTRLSDIVAVTNDREKATVDLSPDAITKDSFIKLFN